MNTLREPWLDPTRHFPEYRELDLYDRAKRLSFVEPAPEAAATLPPPMAASVESLRHAQHALDDHLAARDPLLGEGRSSWQRYLDLPRKTATDKLVAEVFRILRIVRVAASHAQGHVEQREGLIEFACTFNRCALSVSMTESGLALLTTFVSYFLQAPELPYSEAYIELMLGQYFTDIVAEIKKFADEDRILFQFQHAGYFNRHFRYDCDNPHLHFEGDQVRFEINKLHANPTVYPLDFYCMLDEHLHIVPVEALRDGRLPHAQLSAWRARCAEGASLPASFRHRFVRERMIVGQPMT
ncbi:MAG: hypothetical protein ABW321_23640 [Polyangiales bacterium]